MQISPSLMIPHRCYYEPDFCSGRAVPASMMGTGNTATDEGRTGGPAHRYSTLLSLCFVLLSSMLHSHARKLVALIILNYFQKNIRLNSRMEMYFIMKPETGQLFGPV